MRRVVIAGMIGNGFEWYDFALYGYFAPLIGKLFFPSYDHSSQMIATYGVFFAGFIMRPIGAVVFGYLGDKFGRKFSLTCSLTMMALSTALIGVLPTYSSIGIAAPILLAIIRALQGLSLAGQFSGAIVFVVEHAPMHRRGIAGCTTLMSLSMGMLLGSLTATIFSAVLSQEHFEGWGWRIPFLLGLVIAAVGAYIRKYTEESPHYELAKEEGRLSKTPVVVVFRHHALEMLRGLGAYMAVTVPFYILSVYLNGFMQLSQSEGGLGLPPKEAYIISSMSLIMMILLIPVSALLTDKWGRKRVMMLTAVVYFVTAAPLFLFISQGGFIHALITELLFAGIISFYVGGIPALLVELFPTSVRYTGMSISYNVAAVLGGMAPLLISWIVKHMHIQPMQVLYSYIMLCAVISFTSFIGYHDSYKEGLR